ncbi:probable ascorbate-specific transmembrane electron transporter 1 isoform X2 [Triticum aestivum]|uniref:probable ascorbate-specific transmembrane electron transporter 1 isoform X2 n=1 Tax=Triticum aestivum TaxID=4565 RepID=UPI001D01579B|nr:probable ascorbate-specific transmembrane electron transporter 1 isoform X2 [Triticum aestivum]
MDWITGPARSLTLQREDSDSSPSPDEMAVPAPAKAARALAATAAALVLLWCVHFGGGLALSSPTNKGLIFNVHPVLMLIGFIIIGSEVFLQP